MYRGSSLILSGLLLVSSFGPGFSSSASAPAAYAEEAQVYVVVPGDTLWDIAQRFGRSVDALAVANGLSNPNRISIGQRLTIGTGAPEPGEPPARETPSAPPSSPSRYTVAPGDTLSAIALRFSTTVGALARANGVSDPNRIFAGQQLLVPSGPAAAPEVRSLLRNNRMVTYYGMAGAPTMGILGQLSTDELVRSVKERAAAVAAAGGKPVLPTLQLVAAQAMRDPERDGKYRRRVDPAILQRYVDLAAANGLQIILDLQIGTSSVTEEIGPLRPFLERPHVHLALDSEYAMPAGVAPGTRLGSLDADDITTAIRTLAVMVEHRGLPNKVLMVHQFRPSMITRRDAIVNHPAVDLVINMDGFGEQAEKAKWYRILLGNQSVAFASLQIFLRHDTSPFTPAQALALGPAPDVLVYF